MNEWNDPKEEIADPDKAERGRQSYKEGHSFEERVAELYRLLHYDVEHGRLFSGRQVDVFLKGRFGDLIVHRAIECKNGPVKADHIDSFIAKLRLVRREYPSAQGTIISAVSFTDAIKSQAAQEGIQLTLYGDLAAQLLDGHAYAKNLIRECKTNEHYPISLYIEPSIGFDVAGHSHLAFKVVSKWLREKQWNQLTLLGDVGTGKSFLSRMVAYQLAVKFLQQPLNNPLPILIDLRNADRQFSLEGLVLTHLAQNGLERVSFEAFQYALSQGHIVLLLDGFDEMAARVSPQVTNRNFHELARSVKGRAKVLLTCRTHYFKSRTEEEEVVLGSSQNYESEAARDLYWELISRSGFKIAYLRPFEIKQIESYVRRAKPKNAKKALKKIRETYNLIELSQRPMLLEMIVKSIDKLNASEINAATLYKVYTDAWIHRDQWRDVLTPEAKLSFLMGLAYSLWHEDVLTIHHTKLIEYVQHELAAQIQNAQRLIEIDSEIRTASFLTRDDLGNYGFAHKSYGEFFLARYLAYQLTSNHLDSLRTRRLSPEVVSFIKYLTNTQDIEPQLEKVLRDSYSPLISENALLCLYGFRRDALLSSQEVIDAKDNSSLNIILPPHIRLSGARLDQITLEGAVLHQADLSNAKLTQAILARTDLSNANLLGANLEKADLTQAILRSAELSSAILTGANLEQVDLSKAKLSGTNLSDTYLWDIRFEGAAFDNVNVVRAVLSDDLSRILKRVDVFDRLRDRFVENEDITINEYWETIKEHRSEIIRIVGRVSLIRGVDPEDMAQEVFIRLLDHRSEIKLKAKNKDELRAYIRRFASRLSMNYLRHARVERPFAEMGNVKIRGANFQKYVESIPSKDPTPLEELIDSEEHESEEQILSKMKQLLSPISWRILNGYLNGKSLREISAREDLSLSTVHRYMTKALEVTRGHFYRNRMSDRY